MIGALVVLGGFLLVAVWYIFLYNPQFDCPQFDCPQYHCLGSKGNKQCKTCKHKEAL